MYIVVLQGHQGSWLFERDVTIIWDTKKSIEWRESCIDRNRENLMQSNAQHAKPGSIKNDLVVGLWCPDKSEELWMWTRDRLISFFETDTNIFKCFFTDISPAADIQLATDIDIPKFAYRYVNKAFWSCWCGLLTAPTYGRLTSKVDFLNPFSAVGGKSRCLSMPIKPPKKIAILVKLVFYKRLHCNIQVYNIFSKILPGANPRV